MVDQITQIAPSTIPNNNFASELAAVTPIIVETIKPKQPVDTKQNESKQHEATASTPYRKKFPRQTDLKFKTDQQSGKSYFQITDSNGEVLLQVPSEELLALSRNIRQLSEEFTGHLIDIWG